MAACFKRHLLLRDHLVAYVPAANSIAESLRRKWNYFVGFQTYLPVLLM
jgi:hypothetical protein